MTSIRQLAARGACSLRAATTAVVAVALIVPVAASAGGPQGNLQQALAYSRCMRAHGVPRFPDPPSSGTIPKVTLQQLGVGESQWQSAQNACSHLLPNGGNGPSQSQLRQWMNGMLRFAQCMRSHGVPSWPDPVIDAGGNPEFYLDGRVDQNAPQIKSRIRDCVHWLPSFAISPGNPVACPGCGGCGCRRRQ